MIKLINNELIKLGKYKIILSQIIFLIIIYIIYEIEKENFSNTIFSLIPFVGILSCVLFGGNISNELDNGTLRFYLTKPYKRWKIYFSKLFSIFLYLFIVLTFILVVYIIFNKNFEINYIIKFYKYCIPLFLVMDISLCLSSILKNTSLVVGLSIFILVFSPIISQVFFGVNINFIEYTFLPYLDFTLFNDKIALDMMNKELGISLSLNKGIIIDVLSIMIFYIIGNLIFIKKDIRN